VTHSNQAYLFDGALDHVANDLRLPCLSNADRATYGLSFDRRVPLRFDYVDASGGSEVESVSLISRIVVSTLSSRHLPECASAECHR
jgi:hypothetical protein